MGRKARKKTRPQKAKPRSPRNRSSDDKLWLSSLRQPIGPALNQAIRLPRRR